jgi:purine nucleosidase
MDSGQRLKREEGYGYDQVFDFLPEVVDGCGVSKDGPTKKGHAAAEWLVQAVRENPGVALVLTGPLTNIALALRQDPSFASRVGSVSIMGGCYDVEWAYPEFNFECDALAAAEALSANWKVPPVVVGLNLTCNVWMPPQLATQIGSIRDPIAETASAVLRSNDPSGEGCEMFDPCALAAWINPTLFECADAEVWIDESTGFTALGEQAAKATPKSPVRLAGKLRVAKSINSAAFFELMSKALHVENEYETKKKRKSESVK